MKRSSKTVRLASLFGQESGSRFRRRYDHQRCGALLLRQADARVGIIDRVVRAVSDHRHADLIRRRVAHTLETGGMRRVHPRGRSNIYKRMCIHAAALNLSLVMRKIIGAGIPRGYGLNRTLEWL